jgi:hypothetical protein
MTPELKQLILNTIRSAGFVSVEVEFQGGGDEGFYERMTATTEAGTEMDIYGGYGGRGSSHPELAGMLEEATDQHWDWNGGGVSGTMLYDAENNEIVLNMDEEEWVTQPTKTW